MDFNSCTKALVHQDVIVTQNSMRLVARPYMPPEMAIG